MSAILFMPKTKYIGRGGNRPGSGRKLTGDSKRLSTTINIEAELLTELDALVIKGEETRSDIINQLLQSYFRTHDNG